MFGRHALVSSLIATSHALTVRWPGVLWSPLSTLSVVEGGVSVVDSVWVVVDLMFSRVFPLATSHALVYCSLGCSFVVTLVYVDCGGENRVVDSVADSV